MVPYSPARRRGQATGRPQCQTSRSLAVLWSLNELSQFVEVLSGRPVDLEEVAGTEDTGTALPLGTVRADPAPPFPLLRPRITRPWARAVSPT